MDMFPDERDFDPYFLLKNRILKLHKRLGLSSPTGKMIRTFIDPIHSV